MDLLFVSFLAGVLTVLAPCVISILPIILGGSLGQKDPWRPLSVSLSLGLSVVLFSLFLKGLTLLVMIPTSFWQWFSGVIILLFGLTMFLPEAWNKLAFRLKLYKSEELMAKTVKREGPWGGVLLGASLGPVFTTCSPTYLIILAVILPQSFAVGFANLLAYALGLVLLILVIAYGGYAVTKRFKFAVNPNGWFKRGLGLLLIATGLMIMTGYDKVIETKILENGYFGPIQFENALLDGVNLDEFYE
jgi:cytochrome c-type biogenesis protein